MWDKMRKEELICIRCPVGCRISVMEEAGVITVSGNSCGRGADYGRSEFINPERIITCLMRLSNRKEPLSVKTDSPVPKNMMYMCVNEIYRTRPAAPVRIGDVMIRDVCGTGVNVVATRQLD